jgi:hypothetical protein
VIYIENKKIKKNLPSDLHHKFKNTLFKGFTRGHPWVPFLVKQNLNRTQKYQVIALKKIKKTFFKDVTRGGPWPALSREAKFKQDAKPRSIYSVKTE